MGYIFLDESGDLGFDFTKKKTSNFFVIACLYVSDKKVLDRIIKKTFKKLLNKIAKNHCGIFHCHKENKITRINILNRLAETNAIIFSILLYKRNVYPTLRNQKQRLYNYITSILLDRIYRRSILPKEFSLNLIASKRETNKMLNDNFKHYLETKINHHQHPQIKIQIMQPNKERGLQVVNFACWSIFRAKEHGDWTYREIIKRRIEEEGCLFPNNKDKTLCAIKIEEPYGAPHTGN
jgi:hypothetical protein